jgi:DASH complex subunit ASK1
VNELPSERGETHEETHNSTVTQEQSQVQNYEPSIASNESSFMPGQAAFSSTPATARVTRAQESFASGVSEDPSWTDPIESPLVRLDREFREFSKDDDSIIPSSGSMQIPSLRLDGPTPNPKQDEQSVHTSRSNKGKGKEADPLLRNVLRHNFHSMSDTSSTTISPSKSRGKPKTPIPKKLNPYLPQDKDPAEWNGVVDLRDPSVMTPPRYRKHRTKTPSSRRQANKAKQSDDDDSFDGLPPGMSPPVMMSPARPPRSSAELGLLKLGQTPTREASARITRDLVRDIQYKTGGRSGPMSGHGYSGTESSMSTIPTPPSLSRYHHDTTDSIVIDSSLESMMRRVGLSMPSDKGTASTPGLRLRSKTAQAASNPVPQTIPAPTSPMTANEHHDDLHSQADTDADSDSLDDIEINSTANPSAAFMMASAQSSQDDSFGSSSSHSGDSLTGEDNMLAPVNPWARIVVDNEYDSFDEDMYEHREKPDEETLFGVPLQQRIRADQAQRLDGHQQPGLRMLGEDLLQDTIGVGTMRGNVEESPTPAPQVAASR